MGTPTGVRAYSFRLHPWRSASSRSSTLCFWEPVKYCKAVPQLPGARPAGRPACRFADAPKFLSGRSEDFRNLRQGTESGHDRLGVGGCHQQVHIANGLAPAPQAAGHLGTLDAKRCLLQLRQKRTCHRQRDPDRRSTALMLAVESFDACEDLGFGLGSEAGQVTQLAGPPASSAASTL